MKNSIMITANSYKLSGRNALVTGVGRRNGIGTAICRALAEAGANVFFSYWHDYDVSMPWGVDKAEPELLQRELQALGVQAEKFELDLSNLEAAAKLIEISVYAKLIVYLVPKFIRMSSTALTKAE